MINKTLCVVFRDNDSTFNKARCSFRLQGQLIKLIDRDYQSLIDTLDAIWGDDWYDCRQAIAQNPDPEIAKTAYEL